MEATMRYIKVYVDITVDINFDPFSKSPLNRFS